MCECHFDISHNIHSAVGTHKWHKLTFAIVQNSPSLQNVIPSTPSMNTQKDIT